MDNHTTVVENPIGQHLRSARRERGFTQIEVAELLGISARTYGKLERGEGNRDENAPRLTPSQRRHLAALFDMDPTLLGAAPVRTLPVDDEQLLLLLWQAYYSGQQEVPRNLLPRFLTHLNQAWEERTIPVPVLTRGYQVASALLGDTGDLIAALHAAERAHLLAESLPASAPSDRKRTDNEICASLMRRARALIALTSQVSGAAQSEHILSASRDVHTLFHLAPRCRPTLRAVLYQEGNKVLARIDPAQIRWDLLREAQQIARTDPGYDPLGTYTSEPGVQHTLAEVLLASARAHQGDLRSQTQEAIGHIQAAMQSNELVHPRWLAAMRVTYCGILVLQQEHQRAVVIARSILPSIRLLQSARITEQFRQAIAALPPNMSERNELLNVLNDLRDRAGGGT